MSQSFTSIPQFNDGSVLKASELNQLAFLPVELYRLNNQSKGYQGLFPLFREDECNHFSTDVTNNKVCLSNLFAISVEGFPFYYSGVVEIELRQGDTLCAWASIGNNETEPDGTLLDNIVGNNSAYVIDFVWKKDIKENFQKGYLIELVHIPTDKTLKILPKHYFLGSSCLMWSKVEALKNSLKAIEDQLINNENIHSVEQKHAVYALRNLSSLMQKETPTSYFFDSLDIFLQHYKTLCYYTSYLVNANEPSYKKLQRLQGIAFEKSMAELSDTQWIASLPSRSNEDVATGQEQCYFLENLCRKLDDSMQHTIWSAKPANVQPLASSKRPLSFYQWIRSKAGVALMCLGLILLTGFGLLNRRFNRFQYTTEQSQQNISADLSQLEKDLLQFKNETKQFENETKQFENETKQFNENIIKSLLCHGISSPFVFANSGDEVNCNEFQATMVRLSSDAFIDKYLVSVEDYKRCPQSFCEDVVAKRSVDNSVSVNWENAAKYCAWRGATLPSHSDLALAYRENITNRNDLNTNLREWVMTPSDYPRDGFFTYQTSTDTVNENDNPTDRQPSVKFRCIIASS